MKVHIAYEVDYDGARILGVFSSAELASKFNTALDKCNLEHKEFTVDELVPQFAPMKLSLGKFITRGGLTAIVDQFKGPNEYDVYYAYGRILLKHGTRPCKWQAATGRKIYSKAPAPNRDDIVTHFIPDHMQIAKDIVAARKWRAQHRESPNVIVTMSHARDFQININPEYRLQYSDDNGKTWITKEENLLSKVKPTKEAK